jgi:membrane fusion protein (multidrug efflux system)
MIGTRASATCSPSARFRPRASTRSAPTRRRPSRSWRRRALATEARGATVEARVAGVSVAAAALERARLDLEYTKIRAPTDGVVVRRAAEPGHHVAPGEELLSVAAIGDLWVTANFKETQLRRLAAGQRARVHVDALGQKFAATVESLAAASGARSSVLPPENATGNFVKVVQRLPVRLRFDAGQRGLERLRPGMSVEPHVWLK